MTHTGDGLSDVRSPPDPYRWLEENGADTRRWLRAQDELCRQTLSERPERADLTRRLRAFLEAGECKAPVPHDGRYYLPRREGPRGVLALYVMDGPEAEPYLLIDPARVANSPHALLGSFRPSPDGKLVLFELSAAGNSIMSCRLADARTGAVLDDHVPVTVFPRICTWEPGGAGYYYTRRPTQVPAGEEHYHQKLYFHPIGQPYTRDRVVFDGAGSFISQISASLAGNGRYLLVNVLDEWVPGECSMLFAMDPCAANGACRLILSDIPGRLDLRHSGGRVYVRGDLDGRGVGIFHATLDELAEDRPRWKLHLRPREESPLGAWLVQDSRMLVEHVEHGQSSLHLYQAGCEQSAEIPIPRGQVITNLTSDPRCNRVFVELSAPFVPPRVYSVDLASRETELVAESTAPVDPAVFLATRHTIEVDDGRGVSAWLLSRRAPGPPGPRPTVVHGYGGFNVSLRPSYRPEIIPFLEDGGIYVLAQIRGGGEQGRRWHTSAIRDRRQRAFDDFTAIGDWLIDQGYTSARRLACYGWSNGGLLVNVAASQRPDLWRAVVAGAPVTDMARFVRSDFARRWCSDFGSPERPDELEYLLRYSPYHTVRRPIHAPAILMVVPEQDERVAPWHGHKMLATWQPVSSSGHPVLLKTLAGAGHNGGVTVAARLERFVAIWTFLYWQLEVHG